MVYVIFGEVGAQGDGGEVRDDFARTLTSDIEIKFFLPDDTVVSIIARDFLKFSCVCVYLTIVTIIIVIIIVIIIIVIIIVVIIVITITKISIDI